ncbi:hypothetical protein PIB30_095294 [Stylosanthes scabra]|uniref:Uncharacterized protein n=1 Tax=Stylosanthes scabra TaxID=79078 RepID=A0ABU6YX24_9FABA|nr:hypothetical protein [Stylosanthes scabra]
MQLREKVERLIQDARDHEFEDNKFLEMVKARNDLDDYVYKMVKALSYIENKKNRKKIIHAIFKAKFLLIDEDQHTKDVLVKRLKKLEKVFEPMMRKLEKVN